MSSATNPIGIFDSGIGGLSIAQALTDILPQENMIYFGDTAHLPYGNKSTAAIQAYSVKIAHMMLEHQCKLILIACNSASAAAFELVKEYVGSKALVSNVIDPVIQHVGQHYSKKYVGLIGTEQTINSNVYHKKIADLNSGITLQAHATPLLASAIEQGFTNKKIISELLEEYLSHTNLKDIEALILGCTHYPVIEEDIKNYYKNKMNIISGPSIIAEHVKVELENNNLLNANGTAKKDFYISDYTESFSHATQLFFDEEIELQNYPLWE